MAHRTRAKSVWPVQNSDRTREVPMRWTAERIARSLTLPIPKDTAYPELWGFDHAVVLKG